ncbi:MAG TPA: acyl-CoA dehydrogenase family protein [Marmoricola sp.]|nr:acyl-CoA dehydrogenase family protein [Marmoricola sp.]
MDFTPTPEQADAAGLAATILGDHCTPERLKAVDGQDDRFDRALWRDLGASGLLGLALPEEYGGSNLGLLEACTVLVEAGRRLAPVPLATHTATALAIAGHGSDDQRSTWLPRAADGSAVLTAALAEELAHVPSEPTTRAEHDGSAWLLSGTKVAVPAGTVAGLFVVPAATADGPTVFLVPRESDGVTVQPQRTSDGDQVARVVLDRAAVALDAHLGPVGAGDQVTGWLAQRLTLAVCAQQVGTVRGALELTSAYARTREQFGRPIGTFQAVSQRLADGYIDVLGAELTLWQAAWRLSEGLPAECEVATAKLWAADAGHRLAHTTVHVHGGVGIDLDGEAHRFFTGAKRNEFWLGGTTVQARTIGRLLAPA